MATYARRRWPGLLAPPALLFCVVLITGQGCPDLEQGNAIIPIGQNNPPGGGGNSPPFFEFTAPAVDITREVGDIVRLNFDIVDSDDDAVITLMLAPASSQLGSEILIEAAIFESDSDGFYLLNTSSLPPGTYRIVARVNDGVNAERVVVANGLLFLLPTGFLPGNTPPTVVVTEPATNLAVGHQETVPIAWCASDPDDGEDGDPTRILVILDVDETPGNDLDFNSPDADVFIETVCRSVDEFGPREIVVGGQVAAYVIACVTDPAGGTVGECANPANNLTTFPNGPFVMDLTEIQIPFGGAPYYVRVTAWDGVNRPVDDYASGRVNIAGLANSGLVDLADVGHSISGARFLGFDSGAHVGSTGTTVGDFNDDGADDFVVVARWGRSFERGNFGAAYLIYGQLGEKYGGIIDLNSYGTDYTGTLFATNRIAGDTDGIVSVATIDDLSGDGLPEIIFGFPYVEGWYDYWDDDPLDDEDSALCYNDLLPNPLSTAAENDDLSDYDGGHFFGGAFFGTISLPTNFILRESQDCTNDGIVADGQNGVVNGATRIDQGYVIYVQSDNPLENSVLELGFVGMQDPGSLVTDERTLVAGASAPNGVRFRGGWYDFEEWDETQALRPYKINPFNRFGQTVASMPDMSNGGISPRRDGQPELLISSPMTFRDQRGTIILTWGQNFSEFSNQEVKSLPINVGGSRGPFYPDRRYIRGARAGDQLGYAVAGGDFNQDGHQDILCGAPGADRDGLINNGIVYLLFGRLDFPTMNLSEVNPPRIELHGTRSNQRFGAVQTTIGNVDNDRYSGDIGFASPYAGADGPGGPESGFIGIIYAGQRITGENIFTVDMVGGPQLRGTRIYGRQPGGHAGAVINPAGDFNGDGRDDLIIVAPDETRVVGSIERRGVCYVIFGGGHLSGATFDLGQVGTTIPGIVFVSPYPVGSADEAAITWAGNAGDVNGDGYSDLLIGIEEADYVYPFDPLQRRINTGECYLIYGNNTGGNSF